VQRFRGGLELKAHGLCVSLKSRRESNEKEEKGVQTSALSSSASWTTPTWNGAGHILALTVLYVQYSLVVDGGGTQDKKMSKGHLPRVVYHQVYNVY